MKEASKETAGPKEGPPLDLAPGLKCAFSSRKTIRIGAGTTTKKQAVKTYWYGELAEGETFSMRRLNSSNLPSGKTTSVPREKALKAFFPEVERYHRLVEPAMRRLNKSLARADRHLRRGENFSAEMEYQKALGMDEENVRALFGLGQVYLRLNDHKRAAKVFKDLVALDATFEEQHKHLFNAFGIELRKAGLYAEAVEYYSRALEFSPKDDHLHFNKARSCFEQGDWQASVSSLAACLDLNPDCEPGLNLCRFMAGLGGDPKACAEQGKNPMPEGLLKDLEQLVARTLRTRQDPLAPGVEDPR
ncbi:MAG: tetratricopeptide repeat protein [Desulfovibrionaceae bacterium]|nr:tetratricopeptide repeat protein [Desulfovibrionaceae bacterium]